MKHLLLGLVLTFVLLACRAASDQDLTWISEWAIDPWMTPQPDSPVSLALAQKNGARWLFVRHAGQQRAVGTLERRFDADLPVESLFLQVDGNRFLVFFVDAPWQARARSLMLYCPDPAFPDQPELSRQGKIVQLDGHGMGVAPIFPAEAAYWTHLTRLVVTARDMDADPLADHDFRPPLLLRFVTVDLDR